MFSHYKGSLSDFGVRKYEDFSGRFMQPEPLWEKYCSLSPYVYSANNPMLFLDGNGFKFNYSSYNTPENAKIAEQYVEEAIQYLSDNGAQDQANIIIDLKERDEEIYIEILNDGGDQANLNKINPIIGWDPCNASILTNGDTQSPAIKLVHEADHMQRYLNALIEYNKGNFKPLQDMYNDMQLEKDNEYNSDEEQRVIEGNEKKAAEALGEGTRKDHKSSQKPVDGPTNR